MKDEFLITGGCGFLGSSLVKRLAGRYKIVILDYNATEQPRYSMLAGLPDVEIFDSASSDPESLFEGHKYKAVIHTATRYGKTNESVSGILKTNIQLPVRLMELAARQKVHAFINTDSFFVKNPALISNYLDAYVISKRQVAEWMQLFSSSVKMLNLRLEHVFGPFDNPDKFVAWLMHRMLSGEPAIELTDGSQKRDFIYIDDVVQAFEVVMSSLESLDKNYTTFEVGYGSSVKVRHFVEYLKKATGCSADLLFGAVPHRQDELKDSKANNRSLKDLGWSPEFTLEQGIDRMVSLVKQNIS